MLSLAAMEAWRAANLAALELASTAAVATVSFLNTKNNDALTRDLDQGRLWLSQILIQLQLI